MKWLFLREGPIHRGSVAFCGLFVRMANGAGNSITDDRTSFGVDGVAVIIAMQRE